PTRAPSSPLPRRREPNTPLPRRREPNTPLPRLTRGSRLTWGSRPAPTPGPTRPSRNRPNSSRPSVTTPPETENDAKTDVRTPHPHHADTLRGRRHPGQDHRPGRCPRHLLPVRGDHA